MKCGVGLMILCVAAVIVESNSCTNRVDGGGKHYDGQTFSVVISLQVSCNQTNVQFEILIGPDDYVFNTGGMLSYNCFDENKMIIREEEYPYILDNLNLKDTTVVTSLVETPRGCNVTYDYSDITARKHTIQACCEVPTSFSSSSPLVSTTIYNPVITNLMTSTAIPVPTVVSSTRAVPIPTPTLLVTNDISSPATDAPIDFQLAAIILSLGICLFFFTALLIIIYKRYHCYKKQESRQNMLKYCEEFDVGSEPVDFFSKITVTLSMESINTQIFPVGSYNHDDITCTKKEVDCESCLEDDIKSWKFDGDGYLNKCKHNEQNSSSSDCECCHSWASVTVAQNVYSKCGNSVITSLSKASHNSFDSVNGGDQISPIFNDTRPATLDELKNFKCTENRTDININHSNSVDHYSIPNQDELNSKIVIQ